MRRFFIRVKIRKLDSKKIIDNAVYFPLLIILYVNSEVRGLSSIRFKLIQFRSIWFNLMHHKIFLLPGVYIW
jgi:hypothetical protein